MTLRAVLVLVGFTAVIGQIVLMRELIVVFYGNEISLGLMLACWLLWTAIGSGVVGRLAAGWKTARHAVAILELLISLALPATIWMVRASRSLFQPVPGEILGPGPMMLTSLAVLSLFCVVSGCLFAACSRLFAEERRATTATATGSVYLLEAVGSGVGGFLASLVLIRYLSAFEIATLLGLLNLLAAALLVLRAPSRRRAAAAVLFSIFLLLLLPWGSRRLEERSLARLWRGFHLSATRNSVYGHLAVVETEGVRSLFQNGLHIFDVPDPAAAEEAVHFALLQHPAPRSLLLIGGGVNGSLAQAFQHRTLERVEYVELDPAVLDVARTHIQEEWDRVSADPRLRIHHRDGRLFLKVTDSTFDVIIINLPDPQTAQLNRFYTLEFFREAAKKLTADGVLSFQLRGSENYISPELGAFLRCIHKTLRAVFPATTAIPGDRIHFFAATRTGMLTAGPEIILERLRARRLRTMYVREYYIPFRMMPDRMRDLEQQLKQLPHTPMNRDFAPIAYYFNVVLWSAQFDPIYRRLFRAGAEVRFDTLLIGTASMIFAVAAALWLLRRKDPGRRARATFCVTAMGFTLIGLEILLLLGFQAIYGYVYHQLAVVIAGFMMGMALGSWSALHRGAGSESRRGERREIVVLAALQGLAALFPLVIWGLFAALTRIGSPLGLLVVSHMIFPLLALLSGALGGYQFPIASRIFFRGSSRGARSPGALYGFDLLGACLGAVLLSVYLVPVFGLLPTALLMGVVNLFPATLAALAAFEPSSVEGQSGR